MIKENNIITIKIKKEQSLLTKLINNILESLFALFELILDDPIENFWFEIISLFSCYRQIIMFIFNETVSSFIS